MDSWHYIRLNLDIIPDMGYVVYPFGRDRGYVEGTNVYRRKDGRPIQIEDIKHLKQISLGQVHNVRENPGEDTCPVDYVCDSGD